jgi:hypothetical protein
MNTEALNEGSTKKDNQSDDSKYRDISGQRRKIERDIIAIQ